MRCTLALPKLSKASFPDIAENQPEILARHCTEAGTDRKGRARFGAKPDSGRWSVLRWSKRLLSSRALSTRSRACPARPRCVASRSNFKSALITPLLHIKGQAAPETKAAVERAHLLIEQAEALGEPLEDPLLLFVVLYGIWVANAGAFNGDAVRELAAQFLTLAEKQGAPVPLMVGHRLMGVSLMFTGNLVESRDHFDRAVDHFDQAVALYDPVQRRAFAERFGQDPGAALLGFRSLAQWLLGYPEAAAATADQALEIARNSGQVSTLMYVLFFISPLHLLMGNYAKATAQAEELLALAEEKVASFWIERATFVRGCILASTGKPSDAVRVITSGLAASQVTGTTFWLPLYLAYLAKAHAELGEIRRCVALHW